MGYVTPEQIGVTGPLWNQAGRVSLLHPEEMTDRHEVAGLLAARDLVAAYSSLKLEILYGPDTGTPADVEQIAHGSLEPQFTDTERTEDDPELEDAVPTDPEDEDEETVDSKNEKSSSSSYEHSWSWGGSGKSRCPSCGKKQAHVSAAMQKCPDCAPPPQAKDDKPSPAVGEHQAASGEAPGPERIPSTLSVHNFGQLAMRQLAA